MKYCDLLFSINQIIEIYTIRMIVHYTCWINQNFALCLYLVEIGQMSLALFSPMPLQSPVIWSPKSSKPVIIIQFELFCAFKRKSPKCKEETFCVWFVELLCNKTWEILFLDRRKYFPWIGGNPWAVGGWGWGTKSSHGPTPLHCHHIYKTLNRIVRHFVNSKQPESLTPTR